MGREFPDRSSILFGRAPDLAYLIGRSGNKGITAVVGRAQMGKSWLLTELARQLSEPPSQYLVGATESLGETSDLLLRAVVDLYTRWLSDSSYWEQAQVTWQQQKKDLVSNVGKAVGTIFEKLSKLAIPVEGVGSLVKETFEGLASANRELLTGGVQLPRLQIEQGRDLLTLVSQVTGRRMLLVLDQWEKSPAIALESNILDAFARHLDEWPRCHIVLGLRPDEKPLAQVQSLRDGFPGAVEIYDLPPMHLDESASRDLIQHIQERVPATVNVADQELLDMIAGYPGTVARWTSAYDAQRIDSCAELKKVANDANAYRFGEFDVLLPTVSDQERCLAMRLALLPSAGSEEGWKALRDVVLQGLQAKSLDALKRTKLLDASTPPSYGHAKRSEAALQCFANAYREELREESESLIFRLGSRVRATSSETMPFASALGTLLPAASDLELPNLFQAICRAALSLFGIRNIDPAALLTAARAAREDGTHAAVAPLLAMGLYNTLFDAKQEEALERRDALLEELRQLARAYPDDAAVREQLAKGLYNTLNDAKQEEALERRDALLEELRQLARAYPDDAAVREQLAKGLFHTLNDAKQEEALERRDALLEELRKLARAYPDDAAVRERLAKGLYNTLNDAKQEEALERRDALLEELRQLARAYPDHAAVRESLAMGLFHALFDAKQEEALERRDALLEELRQLARAYPDDAAVRERLARGLNNTLNDAKQEEALERRDALLEELRQLARAYPDDAAVREWLARGLFNTLVDAKQEEALERRDALLEELRHLARAYPDDAAVREWLATGLASTLNYAKREEALERRDALLEELRQLAHAYPDDALVREWLARGLASTLTHSKREGAVQRRGPLLEELRKLADTYPQDKISRAILRLLRKDSPTQTRQNASGVS